MNLRQIEVFRAIMLTGGISDAARSLNVSQPNVSRLIRHTEDRLGIKLFERIKGRLYPTVEALTLYEEVEKAYVGIRQIRDMAQDLALSRIGRLRLVCSPSLGLALLPNAVTVFRAQRPGLRISLEILPQAALLERVLTHQADLGISMFPSDHPNLQVERLRRGRLVCVLPATHVLATLPVVTPADIAGHALISYDRDTPQGQLIEQAFADARVPRDIAVEVRFGHTACALVQAGAGVALVDEFSVTGGIFPDLTVRPFRPERWFDLSIVRDRLRPLSRAAADFRGTLRALAAALPAAHELPDDSP
ncbi:LysR family transcriptional regulator [Aliidongia dinghuensis]|uniref:LysR family transcriptional regulator n=1 Tax=Aliidongia dinghuensis TaxID=1867774 RepID=A0A8J3E5E5_9PROT|nr:LysR family transcriptional regulator [Aliidongia dinghuensis]GGF31708.1 LysR family transcriptional regulator [Aliidongia dinghuensis]